MKHLLCVHQALLKFRFLGRRGLLGHFCDLIPRLGWSAMERWPRARLSWEWIWWEPLLSEPSTVFPTASLNRFTCSFPGSILATNLLFCPVGANIFWKITKPSNIGFLVLFFSPKGLKWTFFSPIPRTSPVWLQLQWHPERYVTLAPSVAQMYLSSLAVMWQGWSGRHWEMIISIFSLYLRQFLHTFVFSSLEEVHFHLQTQEPVVTSIYCSGGRIKTWMKQEKVLQGNL